MLFKPPSCFEGLPEEAFDLFKIRDRDQRRREITRIIHPPLAVLGEDLVNRLVSERTIQLHAHLPRLDWPRGYQPFCTWLALSDKTHGYQAGPQLNVGVHATYVAIRLGWDVGADAYGRFEFLCRHGNLGRELLESAAGLDLEVSVYASAPWPTGSRRVFKTPDDLAASFAEVRRHGVWWEIGKRFELPDALSQVCSAELGGEAERVFERLLPVYSRIEL